MRLIPGELRDNSFSDGHCSWRFFMLSGVLSARALSEAGEQSFRTQAFTLIEPLMTGLYARGHGELSGSGWITHLSCFCSIILTTVYVVAVSMMFIVRCRPEADLPITY
ncbi:MAG: hypothetical protein R3C24_04420 [Cyanobacteriota/Melainabacteria group bacterium]